eukprot:4019408-Pyramimonas_sp.AAC.1
MQLAEELCPLQDAQRPQAAGLRSGIARASVAHTKQCAACVRNSAGPLRRVIVVRNAEQRSALALKAPAAASPRPAQFTRIRENGERQNVEREDALAAREKRSRPLAIERCMHACAKSKRQQTKH